MRSLLIGAVLGALVVASAFAVPAWAPAHPVFQTYFALVTLLLAPPILLLNDVGRAIPGAFEVGVLRYLGYAICNAVVYAAAAYWLDRTQERGFFLRVGPLVLLPLVNLVVAGVRSMAAFDP